MGRHTLSLFKSQHPDDRFLLALARALSGGRRNLPSSIIRWASLLLAEESCESGCLVVPKAIHKRAPLKQNASGRQGARRYFNLQILQPSGWGIRNDWTGSDDLTGTLEKRIRRLAKYCAEKADDREKAWLQESVDLLRIFLDTGTLWPLAGLGFRGWNPKVAALARNAVRMSTPFLSGSIAQEK
jgi:hypothetical protein